MPQLAQITLICCQVMKHDSIVNKLALFILSSIYYQTKLSIRVQFEQVRSGPVRFSRVRFGSHGPKYILNTHSCIRLPQPLYVASSQCSGNLLVVS